MSEDRDYLMISVAALVVLLFLALSVCVVNGGEAASVGARARLHAAESTLVEPTNYENISAWEVKAKMDSGEDMTLVDVRPLREYKNGHIAGAVSIPLNELGYRYGELDPAKLIVVYCRVGVVSKVACSILARLGFPNVLNMIGGLTQWKYGLVVEGWPRIV